MNKSAQVFLTNGDEKKEGNFVLSFPGGEFGDPTEVAKEVMKLLDAKGFGKNGKWQVSQNGRLKRNIIPNTALSK